MVSSIIKQTEEFVHTTLEKEGSGHDWWHIVRVRNMAVRLAEEEGADLLVVQLAALLHDIADWKMHGGDDTVGPTVARKFLESIEVEKSTVEQVCEIIFDASFKGAGVKASMKTREGMVVQDADRLDAIGAIGIARTFTYGGHKNRSMHVPGEKPALHTTKEAYFKNESTTINHFYEKLLLLKDLMNTTTAKQIATERHQFMEEYLKQFYAEWEGKK